MRRVILKNFLLLEVILSLGIFALASAALLAPFHIAFRVLQDQDRQFQMKKIASLASIQLHCPEHFKSYLAFWENSSLKNLKDSSYPWHWDRRLQDEKIKALDCKFQLRCLSQTPKRERSGYPAWRRFIEASWQVDWHDGKRSDSQHYFSVLRAKPTQNVSH